MKRLEGPSCLSPSASFAPPPCAPPHVPTLLEMPYLREVLPPAGGPQCLSEAIPFLATFGASIEVIRDLPQSNWEFPTAHQSLGVSGKVLRTFVASDLVWK